MAITNDNNDITKDMAMSFMNTVKAGDKGYTEGIKHGFLFIIKWIFIISGVILAAVCTVQLFLSELTKKTLICMGLFILAGIFLFTFDNMIAAIIIWGVTLGWGLISIEN